jgi:hypothetical protein
LDVRGSCDGGKGGEGEAEEVLHSAIKMKIIHINHSMKDITINDPFKRKPVRFASPGILAHASSI